MVMSPSARTLAECQKRGWKAWVVERWIPQARRRIDLFGFIDIVALDGRPGVLGIQATSGSNVSSRMKKAKESDYYPLWLEAGNRFAVWGWRKAGPRGKRKVWALRELLP